MSIATRVGAYLDAHNIDYDTIKHPPANSSMAASKAAKIAPNLIAKAVVLEDHEGRHLMAVLPADRKLILHKLEHDLELDMHLVNEKQVYQMFSDCAPGAVPALGQAYNMNAIYDDSLQGLSDVYLEGGDHKTLIHLTGVQFGRLMSHSKHARFSERVFH